MEYTINIVVKCTTTIVIIKCFLKVKTEVVLCLSVGYPSLLVKNNK